MEFNVVEELPKKLVAEIRGADHTLCNVLKMGLYGDKHVRTAAYSIKHPLVGVPTFIIETDGAVKPKDALVDAVSRLSDTAGVLKKEFKKLK